MCFSSHQPTDLWGRFRFWLLRIVLREHLCTSVCAGTRCRLSRACTWSGVPGGNGSSTFNRLKKHPFSKGLHRLAFPPAAPQFCMCLRTLEARALAGTPPGPWVAGVFRVCRICLKQVWEDSRPGSDCRERSLYSRPLGAGGGARHTGPQGAAGCRGVSQEPEGGHEWKMWARAFTVVSVGRNGRGGVNRLKTGWIENPSGLWGAGAGPGCPAPGPGVIGAGGRWPRVRKPDGRGGWSVGSGSLGVHVKGALASESFPVSRNPPAPAGAGFPGSAGCHLSDHQKYGVRGAWVALSVKCLTCAQVVILRFMSLRPQLGAWSLFRILCLPLSLCPSAACARSLSLSRSLALSLSLSHK